MNNNNELIEKIEEWVRINTEDYGEWPYSEVIYPYKLEEYLETLKTK